MITYNIYYREGRENRVWRVKAFDELDARDRFNRTHSAWCSITGVEEVDL